MYGAPYIFHFVHPLVKMAKMMVQRVNFERNLKKIRHATVLNAPSFDNKSCLNQMQPLLWLSLERSHP